MYNGDSGWIVLSLAFSTMRTNGKEKMYEKKFSRSGYIFFLLLFFSFFSVVFRGHPRFLKNEAAVFEARRRVLKKFFPRLLSLPGEGTVPAENIFPSELVAL